MDPRHRDRALDAIVARHFAGDPSAAWAAMCAEARAVVWPVTPADEREMFGALHAAIDRHVAPERRQLIQRLLADLPASAAPADARRLIEAVAEIYGLALEAADARDRLLAEILAALFATPAPAVLERGLAVARELARLASDLTPDNEPLLDLTAARDRTLAARLARRQTATLTLRVKRRYVLAALALRPDLPDESAVLLALGHNPDTFYSADERAQRAG